MTQHPPNAQLMAATLDYLEAQLLPTLTGEHRFKTRLAVNALKILQRSQAKENDDLGVEGSGSQTSLATKIRQKQIALDDPVMLEALEHQLRQSLQMNNPKWLNS